MKLYEAYMKPSNLTKNINSLYHKNIEYYTMKSLRFWENSLFPAVCHNW